MGGKRVVMGLGALSVSLALVIFTILSWSLESEEPRPELHPVSLVLNPPSPVEQGRAVQVITKIVNSGGSTAGQFKVEFFLRPKDGEARSWLSFDVITLKGLSVKEQEVEVIGALDTSSPLLIPNPGVYEIRVLVDSSDQIPEQDETNNELVASLTILLSKLGKPDLHPKDLTFFPPSPVDQSLDRPVAVRSTIINTGDKDAGPFVVTFSLCRLQTTRALCAPADFVPFFTDDRTFSGGLARGGELMSQATLSIQELGLSPGTYLVKVTADPANAEHPLGQVQEQDEANNELITALTIQGPELHPISITFPSLTPDKPIIRLGDEVAVASRIVNSGKGTASKFAVGFFVGSIQFDAKTLTLEGQKEAQVQGALKTGELSLNPGTVEIRVIVDPDNRIPEQDETNNEIRTTLTIQPAIPKKPELHLKSIRLNPTSPVDQGKASTVTIWASILNTGDKEARDFNVEFSYRQASRMRWIPLPCVANCSNLVLAAGNETTAQGGLEIANLSPGIYELRVIVDPEGSVDELDETNNELITSLTILAARRPDLVLDPLVSFEPSSVAKRGQTVRISAKITNIGDSPAGAFEVRFSYCHLVIVVATGVTTCTMPNEFTSFATVRLPGLNIGEQVRAQAALDTTNIAPGNYLIKISVDPPTADRPHGQIVEQNELNNELIVSLTVQGPDLLPQPPIIIIPPSPVQQGAIVEVSVVVLNLGVEAVGEFKVEFAYSKIEEAFFIPFDVITFPGLGANSQVKAVASLDTSKLEPGDYIFRVMVDSAQQVEEFDEMNNELLITEIFKVLPKPADLVPLSISFEPQPPVKPGVMVKVASAIMNIGGSPTGEFLVTLVYHSLDLKEAPFVPFATVTIPDLKPAEKTAVSGELDTTKLDPGSYELCVIADPDKRIAELDETNNKLCTPPEALRILPKPSDLVPLNIFITPQPPVRQGEIVKIASEIRNIGEGPAGEFLVTFVYHRLDQADAPFVPFATVTIPILPPGEKAIVVGELDTAKLEPGTYELCVIVDHDNRLAELDEGNNVLCTPPPFEVLPGVTAKPDLADLVPQTMDIYPGTMVRQGHKVHVFSLIMNIGKTKAGKFVVKFFYRPENEGSTTLFATVPIAGLDPDKGAIAEGVLDTSNLREGTYTIIVIVDADNQVEELNELNNQISKLLTLY